MKNNINNYRKELTGYCKENIASATYNEWHFKYLQEKLKNELCKIEFEIERSEKMLSNDNFVAKAPQNLVQLEKEKLEKNRQKKISILTNLGKIK